MPRAGELTYFEAIGESGRRHALGKPFTNPECGLNLMEVGGVVCLLPPPPARVLDCGCGTGWLSYFLMQHGYDVVGTDVSEHVIQLARANPVFTGFESPEFLVADSEDLPFTAEFDAVIFFDCLHHSIDAQAAIDSAFRALKPGGRCLASEPAKGHEKASARIAQLYDTTEKDMPPSLIKKLGRTAGFCKSRVYTRPDDLGRFCLTKPDARDSVAVRLLKWWPLRLFVPLILALQKNRRGLVVLDK